MRLSIFCIRIMHIVCRNKSDTCLFTHSDQLRIYHFLLRQSVILQFQEKITFSKTGFIPARGFLCLFIVAAQQLTLHLSGNTGACRYDSLMKPFQHFHIHARTIIETVYKAFGNNLHQIAVAFLIFCQQYQMIIAVFAADMFSVKTGIRRHIYLAAQDRIDPRFSGRFIKLYHAVHRSMVCNCRRSHAKFFDAGYVFLNLIGTV